MTASLAGWSKTMEMVRPLRVAAMLVDPPGPIDDLPSVYEGQCVGVVGGHSAARIESLNGSWPAAPNRYRDYQSVRVWANSSATIAWTDVRGTRRSKKRR